MDGKCSYVYQKVNTKPRRCCEEKSLVDNSWNIFCDHHIRLQAKHPDKKSCLIKFNRILSSCGFLPRGGPKKSSLPKFYNFFGEKSPPKSSRSRKQKSQSSSSIDTATLEAMNFFGLTAEFLLEDVKKVYRKKALRLHPDKNVGNTEYFTEAMKKLNSCRNILVTHLSLKLRKI